MMPAQGGRQNEMRHCRLVQDVIPRLSQARQKARPDTGALTPAPVTPAPDTGAAGAVRGSV